MIEAQLLLFARCLGLALRAPGMSHPSTPTIVRPIFALTLTLLLGPGSLSIHLPIPMVVGALAGELCLGALMGFAATLVYEAGSAAGSLLDGYTGTLGYNPSFSSNGANGFSRLWELSLLGILFASHGFERILESFTAALRSVPLGTFVSVDLLRHFAINVPSSVLTVAVAISGPAIALALVVHVIVGAIQRLIPRGTGVSIAYPAAFAVVLFATLVIWPLVSDVGRTPLTVDDVIRFSQR